MNQRTVVLVGICSLVQVGCAVTSRPQPAQGQASVWVCHGGRDSKWLRVAAPAADAHRRHGDQVSNEPQREGHACP